MTQGKEAQEWKRAWKSFKEALRDIDKPFDQWYWIRHLSIVAYHSIIGKKLKYNRRTNSRSDGGTNTSLLLIKGHVVQFIPTLVIVLILFIVWCYDWYLHDYIFTNDPINEDYKDNNGQNAYQNNVGHWIAVHYIIIMILWNYILTIFTSPGVAFLNKNNHHTNDDDVDNNDNGTTVPSKSLSTREKEWKTTQGCGGTCYLHTSFNYSLERALQLTYQNQPSIHSCSAVAASNKYFPSKNCVFIPTPNTTFCTKCKIQRPPRCHHCSTCNRCVLQMDHHCSWLNNCIGYNNYRTFCLTIFYFVIGCWYGMYLLSQSYYHLVLKQFIHELNSHVFVLFGDNDAGGDSIRSWKDILILRNTVALVIRRNINIPTPMALYHHTMIIIHHDDDNMNKNKILAAKELIQLLFPLLVGAGILLTIFFKSHWYYIRKGLTQLEYMAMLKFQKQQLLSKQNGQSMKKDDNYDKSDKETSIDIANIEIVNPFDQGDWVKNVRVIIGPNLWYALLPIRVDAPPPYLPTLKKDKDE